MLGELIPEKAIEYKQTLQASNELVTLGSSPTMSNSYTVHLHRVCIMVCCNFCREGLQRCLSVDRDWLEETSFYLAVKAPM